MVIIKSTVLKTKTKANLKLNQFGTMSQGNSISRTGLLMSPKKVRLSRWNTTKARSRARLEVGLAQCVKSMPFSLRPFADLFNPYSRNCSILCNHPGPNEIKKVVKQVKERSDLSPNQENCFHHTCSDDASCDLVNVVVSSGMDPSVKNSDDYFHYAHSDSRPLTPTPTIVSNRTRTSQNSFNLFHRRRCHTPDPVNTCAIEQRTQLVLDLRRSHSQETIYCNPSSDISIQADSVILTSKSIGKAGTVNLFTGAASPQLKNMRLCEQEARKKSAERKALLIKEEPPLSASPCINDRPDVDDEAEGIRRRGKKKKKHKDGGNTFRVNQEPETQITTIGPDSPNASARPTGAMVGANKDPNMRSNDSTSDRARDSKYLRSNFITEDALKILRRGLNIDIVESAFEKFMNLALKEAIHTIPKDQFNTSSEALHEFKEMFDIEIGESNEKWLVMPRQFARSATRFSLPVNTMKLATLTPFEYLSWYVWISDHRKHLYRFVFNKYVCDAVDQVEGDDNGNNDGDDDVERDTPSHETTQKSIPAYEFLECVMPFMELVNAFTNVLGYCGPIEQMADKIEQLLQLTQLNSSDHKWINFRSWCGLVAFAERYLNDLPFEEDLCDEVEIADFETLERKFKCIAPSDELRRILYVIKNNQKD